MPDLTISIVHHDGRDMLAACLDSIFAATGQAVSYEVRLVDNCSTDGSVDLVRQRFPSVRLQRNDRRQGFAANHNQVLREFAGRYVVLLNDDTVVLTGAFERMVAFLDTRPGVGALGCRLLNPDLTVQESCFAFPSLASAFCQATGLSWALRGTPSLAGYHAWPHDEAREVPFVSGACLMVRREVVEQVGLLDEGFFMYAEETDWCRRIRQAGWSIAFCPEAEVIHYGGQSTANQGEQRWLAFHRSLNRYFQKHHGGLSVQALRLLIIVEALVRYPALVAALASPSRRHRALAKLRLYNWRLKWYLAQGLWVRAV